MAATERGKRRRKARRVDPRPRLGRGWSEAAWPRRPAGGGGRGGAFAGLGGGRELGEKGKGGEGILLRPLPWAEVARASLATKAGGSGQGR